MNPSSPSTHHPKPPAGAKFRPPRPIRSLTDLLTDSLTISLPDSLTISLSTLSTCARSSRARRKQRRCIALQQKPSLNARRKSWGLRLGARPWKECGRLACPFTKSASKPVAWPLAIAETLCYFGGFKLHSLVGHPRRRRSLDAAGLSNTESSP